MIFEILLSNSYFWGWVTTWGFPTHFSAEYKHLKPGLNSEWQIPLFQATHSVPPAQDISYGFNSFQGETEYCLPQSKNSDALGRCQPDGAAQKPSTLVAPLALQGVVMPNQVFLEHVASWAGGGEKELPVSTPGRWFLPTLSMFALQESCSGKLHFFHLGIFLGVSVSPTLDLSRRELF